MWNSSSILKINFVNLIQKELSFKDHTSTVLYRIVQELINNVKKHASTSICHLQTSIINSQFTISVEDEGVGFDPNQAKNYQGLNSIKKRITNLNGELTIDSKVGKGTLIIINIPL